MPDRHVLQLHAAVASNTGGPFVTTWDAAVVPFAGTIRNVEIVATSLASNARQNSVDIYYQSDDPSFASNTATTVLTDPVTLTDNMDAASGTVSQAGARVARGGQLQLRTYADTNGAAAAFSGLRASIEIERDPD